MAWAQRLLDVKDLNGKLRACSLYFSTEPPWRVTLMLNGGTAIEHAGSDLFECLVALRRELEHDGLLLCCQGARLDVYPSGMARQSSGGRLAYQIPGNRKPTRDDVVDIFDPADPSTVGSVDAQLTEVDRRFQEGAAE